MAEKADETETSSPVTSETQPPSPPFGPSSDAAAETLPAGGGARAAAPFRTVDEADYDIVGDLAKGGMGRIRHARDRRHGRPVAIKELLKSSSEARQRFRREALITARLQHPAIVPLYEAGTWPNGEPFYSMKLVEGESLDTVVARKQTLSERIALLPRVITVAEAIAYAHDRRIIHRDLKPSNILVGDLGETVVIDWGLAKELGERDPSVEPGSAIASGPGSSDALTVAGRTMGTPAYMPPEQARGDDVDERADVYALGAVLYHLLTGRAPYSDAKNVQELLGRLKAAPPRALASMVPDAPRDLVTIVEKAMARDAGTRYPRARELAADLRRFEAGQLVGAHAYSAREILTRWIRRHRALVAVAAAAAVVAAAVAAVSFRRVSHERDTARRFGLASEVARKDADDRVEQLSLERARAVLPTDPTRAIELARAIPATSRWSGLAQLTASVAEIWGVSTVLWTGNAISYFAAAADGRTHAWSVDKTLYVRGADGTLAEHALADPIATIAISPDGARVAIGTRNGHVYLGAARDAPTLLDGVTLPGRIDDLSLDQPDLLLVGSDKETLWWELGGATPRLVRPATDTPATTADLVFARREGSIELWNRGEARLVERIAGYYNSWTIRAGGTSADRARLFYVDDHRVVWTRALPSGAPQRIDALAGKTVIVWAGEVGGERVIVDVLGAVYVWHGDAAVVDTVVEQARSRDALSVAVLDDRLAIGFDGGDIAIVHPRRGLERTLHGHVGNVFALAAAGHGDTLTLTSASRDGTIRQWRMTPAGASAVSLGAEAIVSVAVTRDGTIAAGGEDGVVHLSSPGEAPTVIDRLFVSRAMALSPDDRFLVWSRGDRGNGMRMIDLVAADRPRFELAACGRYALFAARAPRFACVRNFDGAPILWDTDTWTPIAVGPAGPTQVDSMVLSPDGGHVASGRMSDFADLRIWDAAGGERLLTRIHGNVWSAAFRPSGNELVSGDHSRRVTWLRPGDNTAAFLGEEGAGVRQVVAGARIIAVGDEDGTIGIWDVERGRAMHVRPPRADAGEVMKLLLTPEEHMLVALHRTGALVIWDIANGVGLPLPGTIRSIALSSDGRLLATGDAGGNVLRMTMPSPTATSRGEGEWTPFSADWKKLEPVTPPSQTAAREHADKTPANALAQRFSGEDAFQHGRLDDATTYYQRAVAAGDKESRIRLAFVDAYRSHTADPRGAMRDACIRLGLEEPWIGQPPLAFAVTAPEVPPAQRAELLRSWSVAAGRDPARLNELAYYAVRAGELDLAAQIAERLLAVVADGPSIDTAAEVFHARGDTARAVALSERALSLDPTNEGLRTNLRRFRRARGDLGPDVLAIQEPITGPIPPARIPLPPLP